MTSREPRDDRNEKSTVGVTREAWPPCAVGVTVVLQRHPIRRRPAETVRAGVDDESYGPETAAWNTAEYGSYGSLVTVPSGQHES